MKRFAKQAVSGLLAFSMLVGLCPALPAGAEGLPICPEAIEAELSPLADEPTTVEEAKAQLAKTIATAEAIASQLQEGDTKQAYLALINTAKYVYSSPNVTLEMVVTANNTLSKMNQTVKAAAQGSQEAKAKILLSQTILLSVQTATTLKSDLVKGALLIEIAKAANVLEKEDATAAEYAAEAARLQNETTSAAQIDAQGVNIADSDSGEGIGVALAVMAGGILAVYLVTDGLAWAQSHAAAFRLSTALQNPRAALSAH